MLAVPLGHSTILFLDLSIPSQTNKWLIQWGRENTEATLKNITAGDSKRATITLSISYINTTYNCFVSQEGGSTQPHSEIIEERFITYFCCDFSNRNASNKASISGISWMTVGISS